jgi:hypothetical protein
VVASERGKCHGTTGDDRLLTTSKRSGAVLEMNNFKRSFAVNAKTPLEPEELVGTRIFTWTGNGDGTSWTDPGNWSSPWALAIPRGTDDGSVLQDEKC